MLQRMCFVITIDFCCFRAMTQQSILHLVVKLEVFTINLQGKKGENKRMGRKGREQGGKG